MKKIFTTLAALLLFASAARSQYDTITYMHRIHVTDVPSSSQVFLGFAGYQVAFVKRTAPEPPVKIAVGFKNVELGFSLLSSPGYRGSDASFGDFLDLRVGKSIHFGFRFFDVGVRLNPGNTVQLHTGLHLMCDNYTFSNNITLRRDYGTINPEQLDRDYKKSKLTTAAFGVPVQFVFRAAKSFHISALVYGDLVVNSHTKYKNPKKKDHLSGVRTFQAGLGASLSYKGFGLYGKYGLTGLFSDKSSPTTHPYTVGLYFGL